MGEIQTELCLRSCIDVDMPKAQLVARLNWLQGSKAYWKECNVFLPFCLAVQLVNSNNSTCKDIQFCLVSHYMDLKGHLNNLVRGSLVQSIP